MTDEMKKTISVLIDGFIEKNILHPTSMSEGGVSISYGADVPFFILSHFSPPSATVKANED